MRAAAGAGRAGKGPGGDGPAEHVLWFLELLGVAALALLFVLTLAEIAARQLWRASLAVSLEYQGYLLIASALLPQGRVLLIGRALVLQLPARCLPPGVAAGLVMAGRILSLAVSAALALALWRLALFSLIHDARSYFPSATALFWPQALAALGASGLVLACLLRLGRPLDEVRDAAAKGLNE